MRNLKKKSQKFSVIFLFLKEKLVIGIYHVKAHKLKEDNMKNYEIGNIRTVGLVGHIGSGKTTLSEAMLVISKVKEKMGSTANGTTTSDYHKEEKERHFSIRTSVIPVEYENHKFNIIDLPGYDDFRTDVFSAVDVMDGAVLVIDGSSGVELGTINAWKTLEKYNVPRIIFINKMNKGFINYKKLLVELKDKFGKKLAPLCLPIGEKENFTGFVNIIENKARVFNGKTCVDASIPHYLDNEIIELKEFVKEAIAETSDELLEKFLNGESFLDREIINGLHKGITEGFIVPIIVGSATDMVGINTLFHMMYDYFPDTKEKLRNIKESGDKSEVINIDSNERFTARVFKTIFDPYVGKISLLKVFSGVLKKDSEILNSTCGKKEKISNLYFFKGKEQIETEEVWTGDICGITRLMNTKTGDTICSLDSKINYKGAELPKPSLYYALETNSKTDDEKIIDALAKLKEEDVGFDYFRDLGVKQLKIVVQGEKQLQIITNRLLSEFDIKVKLTDAKTLYKETITKKIDVEGKYKKQSGGAGHYGHVHIKFEPQEEEFSFVADVHGGTVPKQYFPAVEKGLIESMKKGVLGGFPVTGLKTTLYDGSYHTVDSNEFDFKMAASFAYKKAMLEGDSIILEPLLKAYIRAFDTYTKDIIGNLNKKRGKVLNIDSISEEEKEIVALVPESEMFKYLLDLQGITHSTGQYRTEFYKYEKLPKELTNKVIKEYGSTDE